MSEKKSEKPKLESMSARERFESLYEIKLCNPIKDKLKCAPAESPICSPHITIERCEPPIMSPWCIPDFLERKVEICYPVEGPCNPEVAVSYCAPIIYKSQSCGPQHEFTNERLDEIVATVGSIKSDVAELKKKIGQK